MQLTVQPWGPGVEHAAAEALQALSAFPKAETLTLLLRDERSMGDEGEQAAPMDLSPLVRSIVASPACATHGTLTQLRLEFTDHYADMESDMEADWTIGDAASAALAASSITSADLHLDWCNPSSLLVKLARAGLEVGAGHAQALGVAQLEA